MCGGAGALKPCKPGGNVVILTCKNTEKLNEVDMPDEQEKTVRQRYDEMATLWDGLPAKQKREFMVDTLYFFQRQAERSETAQTAWHACVFKAVIGLMRHGQL